MTYETGDRVQLIVPLHGNPKGELRLMACKDPSCGTDNGCGISKLRGTVMYGADAGRCLIRLDRNGRETALDMRAFRRLDAVERLAELA